jgi:hypothetical protein
VSQHQTRIDNELCEIVDNFDGTTRDTLILAREAAHRMTVDNLRSIEIIQNGKDYSIQVRARR